MHRPFLFAYLALSLFTATAHAESAGTDQDKAQISAATAAWVEAFNARDAQRIASLYAPDAVFWGTISPTLRLTPEAVLEYFQSSVTRRPKLRMALVDEHPRVFGDIGINTGAYTSREPRDEGEVVQPSRFTFVYRKEAGRWMIIEHHSSRVPGS
ncbi:MAG: nuclear transport factor 2 family protein [Burkholderiales bacterium]|nr:nuclear transport factor 2 family protein [Burkholderiales bacterium]